MSRINCHSAFKHYEMFHSSGGDVINIGSNNTTIFNMGTGFGGGFWGGVGYGLGNAFGSVFSGMFGGGFGNMGGFGNFGGFGISPFGFGNIFGGASGISSGKSSSSEEGKGKVKDGVGSKNVDYAKLNKLFKRKNDLAEAKEPKLADLKQLESDIDKLAKDLDGNDDGNDNDYIKQLRRGLDEKIKEAEAREAGKAKNDGKAGDAGKSNKTGAGDGANNAAKPDSNVKPSDGSFDDKLKAAGDDKDKLLALINDKSLKPEEKAKAKAKYAATFGFTNYDGKAEINKDNMKLVRDTGLGNKADITTYVEVKQAKGSHPTEITMRTKYSKTNVTYKYVGIVDGEYIYESQAGNKQQYALQKNRNGYALVEYEYHNGYDKPDVK